MFFSLRPNRKTALNGLKIVSIILVHALAINISHAASVIVTNGFDNNVGCTLREAITTINSSSNADGCTSVDNFSNDDTINFNVTSVNGLVSQLTVTSNISFNNNGEPIVISGSGGDRIFHIENSIVSFNNMTVTGGNINGGDGGGIYLSNSSSLTLINSTITGNSTSRDSSFNGGNGGGIFQSANSTLTLKNSSVSGNNATDNGGGIFVTDDAEGGTLLLTNSTISNNSANESGGGIIIGEGTMTMTGSIVSNNTTGDQGGGFFAGSGTIVSLINSTVFNNTSNDNGGGIYTGNSIISLVNTTVSGNSAEEDGGGIFSDNGSLSVTHSTVSGNSANENGGGFFMSSRVIATLANSIVSGNNSILRNAEIDSATITFLGNNLLGDNSHTTAEAFDGLTLPTSTLNATLDGTQPTSINNILSPLTNNGGLTPTHALIDRSPAVDGANNLICTSEPVNSLDQRGKPRSLGSACDLGAFEKISLNPTTSTFVIPLPNGRSATFDL